MHHDPSGLGARAELAVRAWIGRADDVTLERRLGSRPVLRAVFTAMSSRFSPAAAEGFSGALLYELRTGAGRVRPWTVRVAGTSARATPGRPDAAALTVKLTVADFLRLAAGELDPGSALLSGRLDLEGDFALAMKLGPMFGRPAG